MGHDGNAPFFCHQDPTNVCASWGHNCVLCDRTGIKKTYIYALGHFKHECSSHMDSPTALIRFSKVPHQHQNGLINRSDRHHKPLYQYICPSKKPRRIAEQSLKNQPRCPKYDLLLSKRHQKERDLAGRAPSCAITTHT